MDLVDDAGGGGVVGITEGAVPNDDFGESEVAGDVVPFWVVGVVGCAVERSGCDPGSLSDPVLVAEQLSLPWAGHFLVDVDGGAEVTVVGELAPLRGCGKGSAIGGPRCSSSLLIPGSDMRRGCRRISSAGSKQHCPRRVR